MIQCFIGYLNTIQGIVKPLYLQTPVIVALPQNLHCLFLCDDIYDSIHKYQNTNNSLGFSPFDVFDIAIKEYLETIQPNGDFIYIETEYFGGVGVQFSGIFRNGQLLSTHKENDDADTSVPYPDNVLMQPINIALRELGVIRDVSLDEFDTMGLGNYRRIPDV